MAGGGVADDGWPAARGAAGGDAGGKLFGDDRRGGRCGEADWAGAQVEQAARQGLVRELLGVRSMRAVVT